MVGMLRMRFPLGECQITPAAREHLAAAGVAEGDLLARHVSGDFGDLCEEDRRENEFSIARGFRVLSSYPVAGEKVWLITEWDRSRTTILLAREY
jgi:hypothetical protein